MGMRNLCCLCCPSESVTDAAPVAPDDVPTLRIYFAVRIQGSTGTRWDCQEYQIRFRDTLMWRYAFVHLPDTPFIPDSDSSGQEDEVDNNTELDMTAAECDGQTCDGEALNLKSHWSLSTTHSNSSLETIRASGKSHSRNDASMKTSSPSNSVQTMRLISNSTDSAKQSQQPLTHNQPQEQSTDSSAEDIEEEIRRHREDALRRLEGKHTMIDRFASALGITTGRGKSQPQFDAPDCQDWAKLSMLIAGGLDTEGRKCFPLLLKEQEAVLLPIEQKGNFFRIKMRSPGKAAILGDLKAAMKQIEARRWKDIIIFIRYADTPQEQKEWFTIGEPRILDWAPSFI
ncbi:hypothetical protein GGI43DRAFT_192146 [Trichoderma evansii]